MHTVCSETLECTKLKQSGQAKRAPDIELRATSRQATDALLRRSHKPAHATTHETRALMCIQVSAFTNFETAHTTAGNSECYTLKYTVLRTAEITDPVRVSYLSSGVD